jgi:hypothetical protein
MAWDGDERIEGIAKVERFGLKATVWDIPESEKHNRHMHETSDQWLRKL